jgi:hypothetical protein
MMVRRQPIWTFREKIPSSNLPDSSQPFDATRVSEGIRTPDPWGHNPFGITIPLGKSMIYRGVFLLLIGWRGVV